MHMRANATNDPAEWNACSTSDTVIDALEPEEFTLDEYREASLIFLRILLMIDSHMSRIRDARLGWVSVSVALGLTSTSGRTVTEIASEMGISKQALDRPVARVLRMTGLPPAFGLKSKKARINYQKCQ